MLLGVVAALGTVAGLVWWSIRSTTRPARNPEWDLLRLRNLAKKPRKSLTLDEAEDGVVLSRNLGQRELEKEFARVVLALRRRRPRV